MVLICCSWQKKTFRVWGWEASALICFVFVYSWQNIELWRWKNNIIPPKNTSLRKYKHFKKKTGDGSEKKQKQWLLYLNDAVSIFQWWQGGQTSGIIVTRATGCPEEEVRAESCTRAFRARGVDGWEAFTSFPPLCRRPRGSPFSAGLPLQPRMPWPCCTRPQVSQFTVKLQWLTQIKSARTKGIWEPKVILDCRKLEPCRSVFLSGASGSFFSQGFCAVNG